MHQSFNQFSMAGDELNRALLVTIHHMLYPITMEVLHQGFCAGENVIGRSLAVPQMTIFKYENSDGDGVVEVKRILKNKLYQACAAITLIRALTVKVKGSFVQVENQALQSNLMFKVSL
ncbi:hypothetical protein Goari_015030, partial [Gossypium aridum]|nr:hypothetical protein [Gossypium aridum]